MCIEANALAVRESVPDVVPNSCTPEGCNLCRQGGQDRVSFACDCLSCLDGLLVEVGKKAGIQRMPGHDCT